MILQNTKLRNKLRKLSHEHQELDDILLFGSAVRGKEHPADIDILVIFKNNIHKPIEQEIRKELEREQQGISIISKTRTSVMDASFDARESILFEGISLISGKNIARTYGFEPIGIFKYKIEGWNKVKRIQFYYALNGRDGKSGILNSTNCTKFSEKLLLAPIEQIEPIRAFLDSWKIEYTYFPMLIPNRLNKKHILEQ